MAMTWFVPRSERSYLLHNAMLDGQPMERMKDWLGMCTSSIIIIINSILFVLKVKPNTTYKLFARKKNKQRCIEKTAIVNRYKES